MRVRFWGTRGSIATPGASTVRFGGNTLCVELITNSGQRLIFDCGTGARPLGIDLEHSAVRPLRATILLSHTHWDHIQGFPFFAPLFVPGNEFTICAPEGVGPSLANVLSGQMEFTYFPVKLDQLPAKITYRELTEGQHNIDGIGVKTQYLNHPALCLGYRVETDGVSVVYMADHEPFSETLWRADAPPGSLESILHAGDRRHAEFMRGADLVIHDSQYTPEEYPTKRNWGHSTYEYAVELAAASAVRHLALIHHDPLHDDAKVLEIEQLSIGLANRRPSRPHVFCAYEGCDIMVHPLKRPSSPAPVQQAVGGRPGRRLSVLIVDDDPNIHLLAEAALAKNYEVLAAEDGEECLGLLRSSHPDMVVLDLNMPHLGGMAVLKRLRSDPRLSDLPVLVLTVSGDESSIRTAFEAGATDFLTKPFTIPQLNTRVTTCFSRGSTAEPGLSAPSKP
jgi:phosphoribosyl 1,2-cyclic phosphodiesterase/ActR/RegA family two-component response regulator